MPTEKKYKKNVYAKYTTFRQKYMSYILHIF